MQKIKLKTEESGKKLLEAYAPPKWSETADDDDGRQLNPLTLLKNILHNMCNHFPSPPPPNSTLKHF